MVLVVPVDDEAPAAAVWLAGSEDRPYRAVAQGADNAVDGVGVDPVDLPWAVPAYVVAIRTAFFDVAALHDKAA